MSLINKEVADFSVQAYVDDDFQTVTKEDIMGKWSVFFSIRPTSHLCARQSLRIYKTNMRILKLPAARFIRFRAIRTLCIRRGMIILRS